MNADINNDNNLISDFLNDNFNLVTVMVVLYTFTFPKFFAHLPAPSLQKVYDIDTSLFDVTNYESIEDMKLNGLYAILYKIIIKFDCIYEICNYCEKKHKDEIYNFVSFVKSMHDFDMYDLKTLKDYKISFGALKEFVHVIGWYMRNILS